MREITIKELAAVEERARRATSGPWVSMIEGRDHESGSDFIMTGPCDHRGPDIEISGGTAADQDFIAAAREDIPRLVDEIRRLRKLMSVDV